LRENREFLARAVGYVARHGAAQFIEVGSGLPASPGTHEIADLASPGARVAYVDNDPVSRPGDRSARPDRGALLAS